MIKYIYLTLAISFFSFVKGDFINRKISSHVSIDIPKELLLVPLSAETKFAQQVAPMAMYESADQEAKLVVKLITEVIDTNAKSIYKNPSSNQIPSKDINLERLFKKSSLSSQFDAITFYQDTIKIIDGNRFIVYEYSATASGIDEKGVKTTSKTYSYYQICYVKNKTYIFNFYCPEDRKEEWKANASLMMNSIKIKK